MSIGLALSGGGFRATLFHLGVIAFLRDAGKLTEVSHITSVSGGSIIAAHLVLNWESYTGSQEEFDRVACQLIGFVQSDVRGRIYRRAPMHIPFNLLPRSTAGNGLGMRFPLIRALQKSTTDYLIDYYSSLFGRKTLAHLDGEDRPSIYLLTTNQTDGTLCAFTRKGIQCEKDGVDRECDCESFSLATAVAASSAFPGLFQSVVVTPENSGIPARYLGGQQEVYLTDGGVYDNLGLRKFHRLIKSGEANVDHVVVSDASAEFKIGTRGGILEPLRTSLRAADILSKRIHDIELELAAPDMFKLVFIGQKISKDIDKQSLIGVHQRELQSIRTDLDRFSDLEIASLVRHGYCVARLRAEDGQKNGDSGRTFQPWDPLPKSKCSSVVALRAGQLEGNEGIRRELDRSGSRRLRLLSRSDPISYVHLTLILLAIIGVYLYQSGFFDSGLREYTVTGKLNIPPTDLPGITLKIVRDTSENDQDPDIDNDQDPDIDIGENGSFEIRNLILLKDLGSGMLEAPELVIGPANENAAKYQTKNIELKPTSNVDQGPARGCPSGTITRDDNKQIIIFTEAILLCPKGDYQPPPIQLEEVPEVAGSFGREHYAKQSVRAN